MTRAICCNHDCRMFEHVVAVSDVLEEAEQARCASCDHLLVHASGLTFRDQRKADSARLAAAMRGSHPRDLSD